MGKAEVKALALSMIDKLRDIVANDCTDEDIARAMAEMYPPGKGYVKEEDFVNYDTALKMLGLRKNRMKLSYLCKKYGIRNARFNNMPIGFPRKDIERLADILKRQETDKNI